MDRWVEMEKKYYMPTFTRQPVMLVRGQGTRVWDDEGRCYLDLVGGLGVDVLGHCHPAVVHAIRQQAGTLMQVSNLYYTVPQLELAALLMEHSAADKVFFANSGAEANEGAIKLARKYGKVYRGGAYEVVATTNSFHGRTLATLAATGQPKFHAPFAPLPAGFKHVPLNDLGALKQATTANTCAVLLEVVQGESGVYLADGAYLRGVRAWCDEQNLLLMIDEIQTGMGRTGRFLAYEHYGFEPDVFTLAKGLAGGVPVGAVLAKERASVFTAGEHGSTFGGNPLACHAGVATMRTLYTEGLIEHAARVGQYLLESLRALQAKHSIITATRGLGLLAAFDLESDQAAKVVSLALARGVLVNATGPRTIRIIPPLVLTTAEVDEGLTTLGDILASL